MFLVSSRSCLRSIHLSQLLSWEWRCSWSSADRRCSNYIWVINNIIAYRGATYIRGFTVFRCHDKRFWSWHHRKLCGICYARIYNSSEMICNKLWNILIWSYDNSPKIGCTMFVHLSEHHTTHLTFHMNIPHLKYIARVEWFTGHVT